MFLEVTWTTEILSFLNWGLNSPCFLLCKGVKKADLLWSPLGLEDQPFPK